MNFDKHPPVGFYFKIDFKELDGAHEADSYWNEVSGLAVNMLNTQFKEGGENRLVYTLPERAKYQNLICKRGLMENTTVYRWCAAAIENMDIQPTNFFVTLLNDQHRPLQTYHVLKAYPVKWTLSSFNAQKSQIVIESLEFAIQQFYIL